MIDRIRLRLTVAYVTVLAAILVLFGIVAVLIFRDEAYARQDEMLMQEAGSRADSLRAGRAADFQPAPSEPYAAWAEVTRDGTVEKPESAEIGLLSAEQAARTIRTRRTSLATIAGHEGELRVATVPVIRDSTIVAVVQTGQLRAEVQGDVQQLIVVLVPTGVGALVLATLGGLLTSDRAMQPVRESFERQRAFIADASHELKTPLTLIRADAEVLARQDLATDQRALVNDLLGETERMSETLSDLLLLTRLDAGKLDVAHEPFDLAAAVAETRERFVAKAAAATKEIRLDIPGHVRVIGDRQRTHQILAALLDNALRATPSGSDVSISIVVEAGWAGTRILDAGPGIPADQLPHLFQRFYRVDTSRARHDGGSGLGLAIARDLARAQGGELVVDNAPSAGAEATLWLPAGPSPRR